MNRPHPFVRTARTTAIALAAGLCAATLAVPASAATTVRHPGAPVFVQTDNTGGNTIVAYHRAADGSLHRRASYPTGGKGGVLAGSAVDHLASQGSLTYDRGHRLLFAVNAGSNTLTVFAVDGERLHRRQVISSGGPFPVSVTVHRDRVYVLNARHGGSIQGFRLGAKGLTRVAAWYRTLGLTMNATPEFTHTPAQVSFTPDGSQLVVTTKAGGMSIEVFGVGPAGDLVEQPAVNSHAGSVPFGFTFDAHGRLVLTDAGSNAVQTYRLRRNGRAIRVDTVPTGQQATCWIVRAGDRFYASNAGSGTLSGFRQTRWAALKPLGTTATGAGPVDSAVTPDGRRLYVQTGGAGAVDAFRVGRDGSLTPAGTVTVPGAAGGEGIVAL